MKWKSIFKCTFQMAKSQGMYWVLSAILSVLGQETDVIEHLMILYRHVYTVCHSEMIKKMSDRFIISVGPIIV